MAYDSTVNAARMAGSPFGTGAFAPKKSKGPDFLSLFNRGRGGDKDGNGLDTFGKFLGAADMIVNRDRGYPQSRGFGGYGGSSFAGSGGFSQALGGTPGYGGSTFILPPGAGGYGGVGGYGGKRSSGDRFRSGLGGAASGALAGAQAGGALGPHGAAVGAGLGFLSGFLS